MNLNLTPTMRSLLVKNRLWVAWCVELNQPMTPYEALKTQLNNPGEDLTFRCISCHKILQFSQQRRGFLNHPNFRRSKRDSHDYCLSDLSGRTSLTPDARFYQDLESVFAQIASQARKLSKTLIEFETIFLNKKGAASYLGDVKGLLKSSAASSNQLYDALENSLQETEKLYKDFRLSEFCPHKREDR